MEKENYRGTIMTLMQLFKWNHEHNHEMMSQKLKPYKEKVLILKDNREIMCYINEWNSKRQ